MPKVHVVQPGEHLARIAQHHGFADHRSIWDDAANASLKARRGNPNVLAPGDRLVIPERVEKGVTCTTGRLHRFQWTRPSLHLRFVIKGFDGQPLARAPCIVEVKGERRRLWSDAGGAVELPIDRDVEEAVLTFRDPLSPFEVELALLVGHLDPVETWPGLKARLGNLGYYSGPAGGAEDEALRHAVEEFQCDHGLRVDGVCGTVTRERLVQEHGC
jgi:hypothetical protein